MKTNRSNMSLPVLTRITALGLCLAIPASLRGGEPVVQQPTPVQPAVGSQTSEVQIAPLLGWVDSALEIVVSPCRPVFKIATRLVLDQLADGATRHPAPLQPTPAISQGRLVVLNTTRWAQYLSVNRERFLVQPGRMQITVPLQPAEVHLADYESPTLLGMSFWGQTGADYEMVLEIRRVGLVGRKFFIVAVHPEPYHLGFRGRTVPGVGVRVLSVDHGSPAANLFRLENANWPITLERGDVIIAVEGQSVHSLAEYHQAMSKVTPGKVRITIRDAHTKQLVELATPAALEEDQPGRAL